MRQPPVLDLKNLHILNRKFRFWFEFEIVQNCDLNLDFLHFFVGIKVLLNEKEKKLFKYFEKFRINKNN